MSYKSKNELQTYFNPYKEKQKEILRQHLEVEEYLEHRKKFLEENGDLLLKLKLKEFPKLEKNKNVSHQPTENSSLPKSEERELSHQPVPDDCVFADLGYGYLRFPTKNKDSTRKLFNYHVEPVPAAVSSFDVNFGRLDMDPCELDLGSTKSNGIPRLLNDDVRDFKTVKVIKNKRKKLDKNETTNDINGGSDDGSVPVKFDDTLPSNVNETTYKRRKIIENKNVIENETIHVDKNDTIHEIDDDSNQSQAPAPEPTFSWQQSHAVVPCVEDIITDCPTAAEQKKMFPEESTHTETLLDYVHEGVVCDICTNKIVGFRYVCVQCPDVDLCGDCEMKRAHPYHYVLRVPPDRPPSEIWEKLATIRSILSDAMVHLPATLPSTLESRPIEVKEEIDPMDVELPIVEPYIPRTNCEEANTDIEEIEENPSQSPSDDEESSPNEENPQSFSEELPEGENHHSEELEDPDKNEANIIPLIQNLTTVHTTKIVVKKLEPHQMRVPYKYPEIVAPRIINIAELPQCLRDKFVIQRVDKQPKLALKEARIRVKRLTSLEIDAALHNS